MRPISPAALAEELAAWLASAPGVVRAAIDGAECADPAGLAESLADPLRALGRPLVMPPDVPSDRVAALRKALVDTFNDPAFLADAAKNRMALTAPQNGEAVQALIGRVSATPVKIVERLRQLSGEAK